MIDAATMIKTYQEDPMRYAHDALGVKYIIPELRDAVSVLVKEHRVYVKSGHGIGKSYLAAILATWFYNCFPYSMTYTTAPTQRQVRDIIWKEIHAIKQNAIVNIKGNLLTTVFYRYPNWLAQGFSSDSAVAYQGRHSKYMLWIVDEADGIERDVMEGIESTLTGSDNYLFMIGNPVDPDSYFKEMQEKRPKLVREITSYSSPNILKLSDGTYQSDEIIPGCATLEWINSMIEEFGIDSNVVKSRIFAQYPGSTPDALLDEEQCKAVAFTPKEPKKWVIFGVDVAYQGDDESVVTVLSGNTFWKTPFRFKKLDGRQLKDEIVKLHAFFRLQGYELKAIVYDSAGVATAVQEHLQDHYVTSDVLLYPVNFGEAVTPWRVEAEDKNMHLVENKRAEMYMDFRRAVVMKEVNVSEKYELHKVMPKIKYFINRMQKIQIEAKQEFKKKHNFSPDLPDSLILAWHGKTLGLFVGKGSSKMVQ